MKLIDSLVQRMRRPRAAPAPRSSHAHPAAFPEHREPAFDARSDHGPSPFPEGGRDAIFLPPGTEIHAADAEESAPPDEPARETQEPVRPEERVAEESDEDIDRATERLFAPAPRVEPEPARQHVRSAPARFGTTEQAGEDYDRTAVRELFAGIAANHARPVKNLVFELRRGTAQKDWIELCRPVMTALIEGARQTGLSEAEARMTDFDAALALAGSGTDSGIAPEARDLVLGCWEQLAEALPEAFGEDEQERRRETIIIHSLLKQVPGVGHVTFVRLFGAGLTDLAALLAAAAPELSVTTGIPVPLCERICERMREYRLHVQSERDPLGGGLRRDRLHGLVAELRRRQHGYEEACAGDWSDPATAEAKRRERAERENCSLRIQLLLADLGEVALAEKLQAMPYGARLAALEEFVSAPAR